MRNQSQGVGRGNDSIEASTGFGTLNDADVIPGRLNHPVAGYIPNT